MGEGFEKKLWLEKTKNRMIESYSNSIKKYIPDTGLPPTKSRVSS